MKKFTKKIAKKFLRHPLLYYVRYLLLSKNNPVKNHDIIGCLNDINDLKDVPQLYFEVNSEINLSADADEFEKALQIGRFLRHRIAGGPGLGLSSDKTLEQMLAGKGGVCSDFTQVFNTFCFINHIKVREWGCVDRLYKSQFGHAFNEIYSTSFKKWIALDIHKAIYFPATEKGIPLSTIELFQSLRNGEELQFTLYSEYVPKNLERIRSVYSKSTVPFLVSGYRSKVNDYFLNKFNMFPPFMINMIMILFRKNQHFIFVMDNYKVKLLPKYLQNLKLIS